MKTRVLVFPCGSEIGLEIHRALVHSRHVELIGASSTPSNHGRFVYREYVEGVPPIGDPECLMELNALIGCRQIGLLFPAHDSAVLELSERQSELHCPVIGSEVETCQICRSKKETYRLFQSVLAVPAMYTPGDVYPLPVFLKPDVGQGSQGTRTARTCEEVEFYMKYDRTLLLCEYLSGPEYTVDCFTDRHGALRFVGGRRRIRVRDGISVDTKAVRDERFNDIAHIINRTLRLRGAWFFQLKENSRRELVLLEVAPRISGGMGLYRNLGVNFPLLSVFDARGIDVELLCNDYDIRMDRALDCRYETGIEYAHAYVDFEDCCAADGAVNLAIAAFLHQCRDRGIRTHCITRYQGNIREALSSYRIELLFDHIHQVNRAEPKSAHIAEGSSIFIDDSFAERAEVHRQLGIPVFAPDAVESLMERPASAKPPPR